MTTPQELPGDDDQHAVAEANMATVTDDEYFDALHDALLIDGRGQGVDHTEGVRDER